MESAHVVRIARYECDFAFDFRVMADCRKRYRGGAFVADPASENSTSRRRRSDQFERETLSRLLRIWQTVPRGRALGLQLGGPSVAKRADLRCQPAEIPRGEGGEVTMQPVRGSRHAGKNQPA